MGTSAATSAQPDGPDLDLSQRALRFLSYASIGRYLLPLAMILLCGCFVLIHWPPRGGAETMSWDTPTSRSAQLQAELVAIAVLTGVAALGYAGAALLGLTTSGQQIPMDQARGMCATVLASSAATFCLLGVLLTYWWILGVPRRLPTMSAPKRSYPKRSYPKRSRHDWTVTSVAGPNARPAVCHARARVVQRLLRYGRPGGCGRRGQPTSCGRGWCTGAVRTKRHADFSPKPKLRAV
jgi:hypothetical protein